MNYYEIRWINPNYHGDIVEKFDDLVLAQERVREIRKEHGFAPNIFERKEECGGIMALWSHGKSPETKDSNLFMRAYRMAKERENSAFVVCKGCEFVRNVEFNCRDMLICNGVEQEQGNNSLRTIGMVLKYGRCPKGKVLK